MEEKSKRLRSAFLFGFSRKSVHAFVAQLSGEFREQADRLKAELAETRAENAALKEENENFKQQMRALENEKLYVKVSVSKAEIRAREIVGAAQDEASRLSAALREEYGRSKDELEHELHLRRALLDKAKASAEDYKKIICSNLDSLRSKLNDILY